MFNNAVLDVVIGLVFIYLLYSLLATLLQEIIATNINLRGIILKRGIERMLDDGAHKKNMSKEFYGHPLIKYLAKKGCRPTYLTKETFSKVIIDLLRGNDIKAGDSVREKIEHSLLTDKGIKWVNKQNPIWLQRWVDELKSALNRLRKDAASRIENFNSTAGSEQPGMKGESSSGIEATVPPPDDQNPGKGTGSKTIPICDETLLFLQSLWTDSQGDVQKFRDHLEFWFEEMMNRVTGWYKKKTQFWLFFIGLFIAVIFNVDTLMIVNKLQKDPKLREQLVTQADAFVKAHPNLDEELRLQRKKVEEEHLVSEDKKARLASLDSQYIETKKLKDTLFNQASRLVNEDISKANSLLGLGWKGKWYDSLASAKIYGGSACDKWYKFLRKPFWHGAKNLAHDRLPGWLLTAIAISLGAPFWFDLLNKIMKLRGAVAYKDNAQQKADITLKQVNRVG